MSEYLPNTLFMFTCKQYTDFLEFKKYFKLSTEEQQTKMPEKIRTILLDWKENLKEFISICIEEYTNDFENVWLYEMPKEYIDMIRIEEAKIHTYQILNNLSYQNDQLTKQNEELKKQIEENEELKKKIQELEQEKKIAENKLIHIANYTNTYAKQMDENEHKTKEINIDSPPKRQTAINTSQQYYLMRQFANHDDEVPANYWDLSYC